MNITPTSFPRTYEHSFEAIDPRDPYLHVNQGLFYLDEGVPAESAFVYIPPRTECSAASVTLLLPEEARPIDAFLSSGWKEIADEHDLVIIFSAAPDKGWGHDPLADQVLISKLDQAINDKRHYDLQRFCAYLVGYHTGATAALRYALAHPAAYAGIGLIGSFESADSVAPYLSEQDNTLPYTKQHAVPIPLFLAIPCIDQSTQTLIDYFVARNKTTGKLDDTTDYLSRFIGSSTKHVNEVNDHPVRSYRA